MRFDLVDRGARTTPRDPTRPLADALASAGHAVRLFSTEPDPGGTSHVERIRLAVRGTDEARNRPALAKALGALLDPAATTVLPYEFAGLKGAAGGRVLSVLPPLDAAPVERGGGSWLDRLFGRRAARKEEALALGRSRWILAPGETELGRFTTAVPSAAPRVRVLAPPVPLLPESPDREAARRALRIPDDVPVATYLGPPGDAAAASLTRAAFQRARVFFPGARLLLPGVAAGSEPGTHALPTADAEGRRAAVRAADLIVAPSVTDPVEMLRAARSGLPVVLGRGVVLPRAPPPLALRRPEADDAGALASELAELFADPALRRRIGDAGREYADGFSPEAAVTALVALAAP